MFQCTSFTKWPKTGTFTLHIFGYCTDKNFITTEVNVHIHRETWLIFKYSSLYIIFTSNIKTIYKILLYFPHYILCDR